MDATVSDVATFRRRIHAVPAPLAQRGARARVLQQPAARAIAARLSGAQGLGYYDLDLLAAPLD